MVDAAARAARGPLKPQPKRATRRRPRDVRFRDGGGVRAAAENRCFFPERKGSVSWRWGAADGDEGAGGVGALVQAEEEGDVPPHEDEAKEDAAVGRPPQRPHLLPAPPSPSSRLDPRHALHGAVAALWRSISNFISREMITEEEKRMENSSEVHGAAHGSIHWMHGMAISLIRGEGKPFAKDTEQIPSSRCPKWKLPAFILILSMLCI